MTEKAVQNIYNKLFDWEGKNASLPYPIHKRLHTETFGYGDVYEWIADTYNLNSKTKVLDAGCGVGYGAVCLSKQKNCDVLGISLSHAEIKKAREFANTENLDNSVSFSQQSYDNLQPDSFDFIIAIESIKHTLNLDKTILSLKNALKTNGVLVIIDDYLISNDYSSSLSHYAQDWALKVLLKHHDFLPEFTLKKDLTPHVKTKNSFLLSFSILLSTILKPFVRVSSIMRGGLYLEKLFKSGVIKYYVLEYKKLP